MFKSYLITIEICRASYSNLLLSNWHLLGVEMNLGHAHKTRFWYLLGVPSRNFIGEYPPGNKAQNLTMFWCVWFTICSGTPNVNFREMSVRKMI